MKFGSGFPEDLTTIIEPNLPNKISLNKNIANLSPKQYKKASRLGYHSKNKKSENNLKYDEK